MIWSPLAGGRLFTGSDEACVKVRGVLKELAEQYGTTESAIVYAWLAYHPVKAANLRKQPDRPPFGGGPRCGDPAGARGLVPGLYGQRTEGAAGSFRLQERITCTVTPSP